MPIRTVTRFGEDPIRIVRVRERTIFDWKVAGELHIPYDICHNSKTDKGP